MDPLIVECPHCKDPVMIESVNCGIFRHGTFKNFSQVNPHESKENCDRFTAEQEIYGCGKPFQIINNKAEICQYI